MNGYGHFVPALFWSITYWLSICCVLGVVSIAFARRGAEDSLRRATAPGPPACSAPASRAALSSALIAIGSGAWYFYNAHVLNEYLTAKDAAHIQADYERDFKKYEHLPQPKIIAVDANIDIYPERRSFNGTGHLLLQNKTPQPISADPHHRLASSPSPTFSSTGRSTRLDQPADLYSIYAARHSRSRPARRST